jgi:hypothetical protein
MKKLLFVVPILMPVFAVTLFAYSNVELVTTGYNALGPVTDASGDVVAWLEEDQNHLWHVKVRYGNNSVITCGGYNASRPSISKDGELVGYYAMVTSQSGGYKPHACYTATGATSYNNVASLTLFAQTSWPPAVTHDPSGPDYIVYQGLNTDACNGDPDCLLEEAQLYISVVGSATRTYVTRDSNGDMVRTSVGSPVATQDETGDVWIAYSSNSPDLPGTTSGSQIFRAHDDGSWIAECISTEDGGGDEANGDCIHPSMDVTGNIVAFSSVATNLTSAADTGPYSDVFVKVVDTDDTYRAYAGNLTFDQFGFDAYYPWISPDGTRVALHTKSQVIVPGYSPNWSQFGSAYTTQACELVSFDATSRWVLVREGRFPSISDTASSIVFDSNTPGIVAGDNDGVRNIIRRY